MFDIGLRLVIGVAQYKQETFMETTNTRPRTKIVIVGGVAGGASCAARLRRLDENAEIIMVEKGRTFPMPIAACPTMSAA
jgi:hypothetical protein